MNDPSLLDATVSNLCQELRPCSRNFLFFNKGMSSNSQFTFDFFQNDVRVA